MYVDETGNADLAASANPVHRFLSLTGVIAQVEHIRTIAIPEIQRIKSEILELDPDEVIPLHRKELMQKVHPFKTLRNPAKATAFNEAILNLLNDLPYIVVTVVIDKEEHLRRYAQWSNDPYHYCLKILFERYCLILNKRNGRGDVVAESRGKREDERLFKAYEQLYGNPAPIRPEVCERCLTSKNLKIKRKEQNTAGLQIADLIAHPSSMHARSVYRDEPQLADFGGRVVEILKRRKYHRSIFGRVNGYGLKWLP